MVLVGNAIAARVRLSGGRRLNSPALIADRQHARSDAIVLDVRPGLGDVAREANASTAPGYSVSVSSEPVQSAATRDYTAGHCMSDDATDELRRTEMTTAAGRLVR